MQHPKAFIEKRYLYYQVFSHVWLVGAVWLLFYRLFMSDQQVGILDAISFGIGLLAEIPSGALADHFGRKRITIIGIILSSTGMAMQGLAGGYALILFGQTMLTIGFALRSGADEALFYEALNYDEESSDWKKLVSKASQIGLITTLLSYIVGGYLYTISPGLPFIASFITICAVFAVWRVPENKSQRAGKESAVKEYVRSLVSGVKQLGHKRLIGYLPIVIVIQGLFYSFGYGLLRPIFLTRFNFSASGGAWVLFACGAITFILQRIQFRYIDKISEKFSIAFLGLLTALALFAGVFNIGHIGFLIILTIYAGEYLIEPLISNGLNTHIVSSHRATALSAASFIKSLPYVLVAPIIGYLNVRDKLQYFLIVMSALCVAAVIAYLKLVKEKPSDFSQVSHVTMLDNDRG